MKATQPRQFCRILGRTSMFLMPPSSPFKGGRRQNSRNFPSKDGEFDGMSQR